MSRDEAYQVESPKRTYEPCWRCHGYGSVQVSRTEGAECPRCKGVGCLPVDRKAPDVR
jgi:hypothetical protein